MRLPSGRSREAIRPSFDPSRLWSLLIQAETIERYLPHWLAQPRYEVPRSAERVAIQVPREREMRFDPVPLVWRHAEIGELVLNFPCHLVQYGAFDGKMDRLLREAKHRTDLRMHCSYPTRTSEPVECMHSLGSPLSVNRELVSDGDVVPDNAIRSILANSSAFEAVVYFISEFLEFRRCSEEQIKGTHRFFSPFLYSMPIRNSI